jgi:hypothetical protein
MKHFDTLGVMLDCSRNAVMKPEKVKEYAGEAERIFAEYFSLDKSDLDEIYDDCVDEDGYVYYTKIQEWAKKTGGAK